MAEPLGNSDEFSTAAPPPTPSAQPNNHRSSSATSDAADALWRLLHRLPPSLSLPSRHLSPPKASDLIPTLSFSPDNPNFLNDHLNCFSHLGFFQLTDHHVPSQLARSAELESQSLFDLPRNYCFPNTWPLGFDDEAESLCLDESCFPNTTATTELSLAALRELARELEKLGSQVVDSLSQSVGFEKGAGICWLIWVSRGVDKPVLSGRLYPYIVALEYQIRRRECSLLGDSGWVSVTPEVDSVLVTIGDIAQVWSNGKLKKVRGKRVVNNAGDEEDGAGPCVTISLLMTLPTHSSVSVGPRLLPAPAHGVHEDDTTIHDVEQGNNNTAVFSTFSLEDYAWTVYHERFPLKDPLVRYRT